MPPGESGAGGKNEIGALKGMGGGAKKTNGSFIRCFSTMVPTPFLYTSQQAARLSSIDGPAISWDLPAISYWDW